MFESDQPLLSPFYRSCVAQDAIDAAGLEAIAPLLDLFQSATASLPTHFHALGVLSRLQLIQPLVSLSVEVDPSAPSRQWLILGQPPLSLPSASLYADEHGVANLTAHIARMWLLTGASPERAAVDAERATTMERLIASISVPPTQLRNPEAQFNPTTLSSLCALAPGLPWDSLFAGLEIAPESVAVNVAVPSYLSNLSAALSSRSDAVPLLQAYARWRVLHFFAPDLPRPFATENFDFFDAAVHGQKEPTARWRFCVDRTVEYFSELSGAAFMRQQYSDAQRGSMTAMIGAIKEAMWEQLSSAQWLDGTTRLRALGKLEAVIDNVGGAGGASIPRYDGVQLSPLTYLKDLVLMRTFDSTRVWHRLFQPTDRRRWQMSASEGNAYYERLLSQHRIPDHSYSSTLLTATLAPLRPVLCGRQRAATASTSPPASSSRRSSTRRLRSRAATADWE